MKLGPFFSYFGGKFKTTPKYPKPIWKTIVEPFAGSAGYSLRYHHRQVLLYDLNAEIFCTWRYLISVSAEEIMSLPLEFDDVRDCHIAEEAKFLIGWHLNPPQAKPTWKRVKRTNHHYHKNSPCEWTESCRERIARQLPLIRHWKVYNQSYLDAPDIKATWFLDPPYQSSGKFYSQSNINYGRLGAFAKSRHGQLICCGQPGDDWIEFEPFIKTRINIVRGPSQNDKRPECQEMIYYRRNQ